MTKKACTWNLHDQEVRQQRNAFGTRNHDPMFVRACNFSQLYNLEWRFILKHIEETLLLTYILSGPCVFLDRKVLHTYTQITMFPNSHDLYLCSCILSIYILDSFAKKMNQQTLLTIIITCLDQIARFAHQLILQTLSLFIKTFHKENNSNIMTGTIEYAQSKYLKYVKPHHSLYD